MISLTEKTFGALRWSALHAVCDQGIRFAVSVVIARLLLPQDYGLTAMLALFIGVGELLISSGFARAIIQSKQPSQVELSSVFYFNCAMSLVCAGLLIGSGPLIAAFYRAPILAPMAVAMSANFLINALGLVQFSLLTRELDFKTQFRARMIGVTVSGTVGIGMAYCGFGVWSLVAQTLVANVLTVGYYWLSQSWKPSWVFRLSALKGMFAFGSKLLLSGLLDVIFGNIYAVVIGKTFSTTDLGLYTRAEQLQQMPVTNILSVTDRVTFSSLASIQEDKARLTRALRKTVRALAMILFPAMVGLAIIARPLVLVTLTAKWEGCVSYLQLLCVVGAFYPLHMTNLNALTAQGRSDLYLQLMVINKCLVFAAVALTWRWGIIAMIYGQIGSTCICYYLNTYYTKRILGYGLGSQLKDVAPYASAASVMGMVLYLVHLADWKSNLSLLLTQCATGVVAYVATCRMFSLDAFMELWHRWPRLLGIAPDYS